MWWIGEKAARPGAVEHVRAHLARAFGRPNRLAESPERPLDAWDARRRQHSSSRILRWLGAAAPPGKVLGLTDQDLFIPILTFVFGEAQLGGRAAVVSIARLGPEGPHEDPRLAVERLAKEAVHELGHAFGLLHCGTRGCVMSRSASVRDVDLKSGELCPACRSQLAGRGPAAAGPRSA